MVPKGFDVLLKTDSFLLANFWLIMTVSLLLLLLFSTLSLGYFYFEISNSHWTIHILKQWCNERYGSNENCQVFAQSCLKNIDRKTS